MRRWLDLLRRRWLLLVVIGGFIALIVLNLGSIVELIQIMLQGEAQWLAAAIVLQAAYHVTYAGLLKYGFLTVEVVRGVFDLLPVWFASIFLKAIVPSGGVSSLAVFIDDACRAGQSAARAAEGSLLVLVAHLATMIPLIAIGLGYLAFRGVLQAYQWIASLFFVIFVAGLSALLLLGRWRPAELRGILLGAQRSINGLAARLRRSPVLAPNWSEQTACEFISAACDISRHPRELGITLAIALAVHLINVTCLFAVSLAYREPLGIGPLLASFSMDIVFSVITFIPHGIGIAEGVMTLVLDSVGVPVGTALVITLVFRGLNVWLPLVLGFFFLQRVRALGGGPPPESQVCERPPSAAMGPPDGGEE
jgi:uncharacterized membrane protein YbhN (UPF0104 family)